MRVTIARTRLPLHGRYLRIIKIAIVITANIIIMLIQTVVRRLMPVGRFRTSEKGASRS